MNIPWDKVLELLFAMLENCGESPASRANTIRNNRVVVWFAAGRALRQVGVPLRQRAAAKAELFAEIEDATDDQIMAFATGGPLAMQALTDDSSLVRS